MNRRLGFDDRGETSKAIEKLRREHPEWPSSEIARVAGVSREWAHRCLSRAGLRTTASWWPVHDEHSDDKSEPIEGIDL